METFILMDGAMVYEAISASRVFAELNATWFATLMPSEDLRLAGPILIFQTQALALKSQTVETEIRRLVNGFPHRLHFVLIESEHSLDSLADHLRSFVYFGDDTGQPYGLRIADSRVMAYLPGVLTPAQWDALTAPMVDWKIHDRAGLRRVIPLYESRLERTGASETLQLSDAQIDLLIQAGEPDALLAQLARSPEDVALADVKWHYEVARYCIERWQQSGSTDRGALLVFARRVFASERDWLKDAGRVQQELLAAAASVT
ncbi:hypothetical protein RD110_14760 [Rhodoferax koreense]|uniref:DUF4123 domain-containing protein n=1 Tax=Rhodoferax koreensis TaxID=1842727 RepID=A0A1P8JX09_9BURK|nr:DUF4123 domain-containing protein [Rhodoferax koreense]APW38294.1 hypothetical protein RD110_14760 [Rhodoferax koreense]